jgi:hypothetical protein
VSRIRPEVVFGVALPALVAIVVGIMAYGERDDEDYVADAQRVSTAPFEAESELEDLLLSAGADAEQTERFLEELVESTVFVVAQGAIADARQAEQRSMPFSHITFRGQSMLPVYTTRGRVPESAREERVGTLPFATILEHLEPPSPIVVNPGTSAPMAFSASEVAELRARHLGLDAEPEVPELAAPMPSLEPLEPLAPAALSERMPEPARLIEPLRLGEPRERARPTQMRGSSMGMRSTPMAEPTDPAPAPP